MKILSETISPKPFEIRTPHVEVLKFYFSFYKTGKMYITRQLIKDIKRK